MWCVFDRSHAGARCRRCGHLLARDYPNGFLRLCGDAPPIWDVDRLVEVSGLARDRLTWFVRARGLPPGCCESQAWWLRKFEAKFGAEAAEKLKLELFG